MHKPQTPYHFSQLWEVSFSMAVFVLPCIPIHKRKLSRLFLAFCWVSGILAGVWVSCLTGDILLSLMRRALMAPVSISGLLTAATFPFLISALAVFLSCPSWLFLFSFLDGLLYGLSFFALYSCFASTGWLLRSLLCFSALVSAVLTFWYRLRYISGERKFSYTEFLLFGAFAVLIGSIDYAYVAPLLARLLF